MPKVNEKSLLGCSALSYGSTSQKNFLSLPNTPTNNEIMDNELLLRRRRTFKLTARHWWASAAILFVVTLERIAFYSLAGNLLLFLNQKPFLWMSYNAMTATLILTGVSYICSLFGGWLADSILGRYWTIFVGLLIYIIAYGFLPVLGYSQSQLSNLCLYSPSSYTNDHYNDDFPYSNSTYLGKESLSFTSSIDEPCSWLIYTILVAIGLAVGLVKTNIAPFGADQVHEAGPATLRAFFNWFYWSVNIGGLCAVGGIAYIQQSIGFYWGYLIPMGCLSLAFLIFFFGRTLFIVQKPVGSIFTTVVLILKDACKFRFKRQTWMQYHRDAPFNQTPSSLDMTKVQYGGKFHESSVDDVKLLGKVLVILLVLVPYWLVYFQMQTTFLLQGLHMRLGSKSEDSNSLSETTVVGNVEVHNFSIPAAWLTLFDIIFLLIFIPLMDRVIYPCFDRRNINIPLVARIIFGMFFAMLAMVVAGGLESYRLDIYNDKNETFVQVIGNTTFYAADMWIFWQIPQYSLIGISEVFASVAALEFAYRHAPRSMQSMVMGLFSLSTGVGSFLGTGLLNAFKNVWLMDKDSGNINYGHLDYYFYLLSGIQAFALIIFVIITICCKNDQQLVSTISQNEVDEASENEDYDVM